MAILKINGCKAFGQTWTWFSSGRNISPCVLYRHSQFIVVSLKDGMFNNANVLFKTKFVDGVSTVTRLGEIQGAYYEPLYPQFVVL